MSGDDSAPQDTLYVTTIDISLAKDSRKTIESIKLKKNDQPVEDVPDPICVDRVRRIEFGSPLALDSSDHISISVSCSWQSWSGKQVADIPIDINFRDVERTRRDKQGTMSYRKKERNVEVVVATGQPQSVYGVPDAHTRLTYVWLAARDYIFDHLVLSKVPTFGHWECVGKSSLIHKVFGVESVHASQTCRGGADINTEFVSPKNNRIVVHDSLGFEAGDEQNIDIVTKFITRRKAMSRLEDQVHAIWLCLEMPYSGGRLLESGAEKFLQRRSEILGDVPLVVVLTKMDLLDEQSRLDCPSNESEEHYKSGCLDKYCIRPLHKAAGSDVTHVTVSTLDGHSGSLSKLFQATEANMAKNHVDEAPRIVASIAQRISIKEKLEASIAIGKKKYWKTLLKSTVFRGRTLGECLKVIRQDVITVWNFDDPDQCLMDDNIIGTLLCTDNLASPLNAASDITSFGAAIVSCVGIAETLAKSGDITLTMAGQMVEVVASLLKIMYGVYQEAPKSVRILMFYTVDLVCVMQAIFLIAPGGRVTDRTVALALKAYEMPRKHVHQSVDKFNCGLGVVPGGRDRVLDTIEELIWRFSIADGEIEGLRKSLREVSPSSSS